MTQTTADKIMVALLDNAPAARVEALQRLQHACDEIEKNGVIKLKAIEVFIKRSYGEGTGPRAQSISNERIRPLGMYHYVAARNRERIVPERERRSKSKGSLVRQIELIPDMDLRVSMRDLYDRLNIAEAHLSRAKHLLKTVRPGLDVQALLEGREQKGGQSLDGDAIACLNAILRTCRDEEKLRTCGLSCDHGAVQRRTGTRDELFGATTISRLAALLKELQG